MCHTPLNTRNRSITHSLQPLRMSFDEIFDLTTGVFFLCIICHTICTRYKVPLRRRWDAKLMIFVDDLNSGRSVEKKVHAVLGLVNYTGVSVLIVWTMEAAASHVRAKTELQKKSLGERT